MERIWIIISGLCAIAALALLFARKFDGAFVVGAIGVLVWFVDVRIRLSKERKLMENVVDTKNNRSGEQDEE
jgi:hypothetical protein